MVEIKEVLEFIKNSNREDLKILNELIRSRYSEIQSEKKSSFRIGDIVGIDHKTVDPDDSFKVTKIMKKNIGVQKINTGDGRIAGTIRVSPSLLVKFEK